MQSASNREEIEALAKKLGVHNGIAQRLCSADAKKVYELTETTPEDFKNFKADKIKELTSFGAQQLYGEGYTTPAELASTHDIEKIRTLTNDDIIQTLQLGKEKVDFQTLSTFSIEGIKFLTSGNTLGTYCRGGGKLKDLEGIEDAEKIKALVTNVGRTSVEGLNNSQICSALKGFSIEKIKELTSPWARGVYNVNPKAFNTLKDFEAAEINFLVKDHHFQRELQDQSMMEYFSILKDKTKDELEKMSKEANVGLEGVIIREYVRKEIGACPEEKAQALTSENALRLYKEHRDAFNHLKDHVQDVKKIKALTACYTQEIYIRQPAIFDRLKDLDVEKIELLEKYGLYRTFFTLALISKGLEALFDTLQEASANDIEGALKSGVLSYEGLITRLKGNNTATQLQASEPEPKASLANKLSPSPQQPTPTNSTTKPDASEPTHPYEFSTGIIILGLSVACVAIIAALYFNGKDLGGRGL